jgi:hypothetical protein
LKKRSKSKPDKRSERDRWNRKKCANRSQFWSFVIQLYAVPRIR